MMKRAILAIAAAGLPALATDLPPYIPGGPVTYDSVSYESPDASYDPYAPATAASYTMSPVTPSVSAGDRGYVYLNAYTSNYNVRGMGFTNDMSNWGYSSVRGSYVLPGRNLFGLGMYQRVSGSYGIIWDAGDALGDKPLINASYAIGKEIFPNLKLELGHTLYYGGIEGYMAKHHDDASHSSSHDLNLSLRFNDGQKGFFGNMTWGWAFKGLNGIYGDIELGYRFTNVLNGAMVGADLELSAGVAPSFSYWTNGADGVDAYRIRAALPLFTHRGTMGRDARLKVIPWAQASWSGNNAGKIDRDTGYGPVDHFIITVGLDVGWHF